MFADHLKCIQECSWGLQNCNMVASRLDIGDMCFGIEQGSIGEYTENIGLQYTPPVAPCMEQVDVKSRSLRN